MSDYYTTDNIDKENADYNVIFGERSNGKTTAVLGLILQMHIDSNYINQGALIRRWEEDFKGKNGVQLFDGIISLGWIEKWTKGKYNSVLYYSQRWFLVKYNKEGKKVKQEESPFLYGFSISNEEHYKSTAYPKVKIILFDEFITRQYYLQDEFIKFQNLLSTIIRLRDDVKIYMCGNTVNRFCPYFDEMGLSHIKDMKEGKIDVYSYGETNLKVAVEYSVMPNKKKKKSNKYFAFNNPKLNMIKHGSWEIDIYPHLPYPYLPKEVVFKYYIEFDNQKFECVVISSHDTVITFIHRKTTPITETDYPVYSTKVDPRYNYSNNIYKPRSQVEKVILQLFRDNKIFYQDNEVGEVIRNYLIWCQKR